ncbi:hypothetical protein EYC84_007956 [Monilinia fructicola]|uniref:Fungal N-terminal domain-containing protein n=1 Tax=Monilinia fructicola TaxID=38448 RepID=A0A5M9JJS1_MONFR|nr:hypothetical protein EYC84_007956 [Monilinia fructicola]
MAALSVGASVTAFLGLADIVYRYTLQRSLHRFGSSSPEYHQSPYVLEDAQSALSELERLLRDCETELEALKLLLNEININQGDGWVKRWSKNLSWGLDDQKISKCCQQLETYKSDFNLKLSPIGRKNDIVNRKQLKETRHDLKKITDTQVHTNLALVTLNQM